ncbi:MAG: sensor histidine kinase, partial [Ktedonobacterales bacterium]
MLDLPIELNGIPGGEGPTFWSYDLVPLGEPREPRGQVLLVLNDCTEERRERHQAEQMAFSAQLYAEKLEAVIEQITEAVMVVDQVGHLLAYNRAALSFASNREAVERARSRGMRVEPEWDLSLPDKTPLPEIERPAWRAMLTGAPITGSQLIIRRENGAETPLLAHAAPLRDEGGAITSAVVAFQDITAFKELERLKDEFISVASHELKQPLTVINGQAQLLKRHLRRLETADMTTWNGGDTLRQLAEGIEAQAARLNLLVSDLLDMSRIQAGQLQLDLRRTSLWPMIERLLSQQRATTLDHTFQLSSSPLEQCAEIAGRWDTRRVEQILMNLLSNAVKYSPSGGQIAVRVEPMPEGYVPQTRLPGRPRRVAAPAVHLAIADQG